jgi:hypothetical protein
MEKIFFIVFYILVLLTSLPMGYFLARLCKDELVNDRKYFFLLIYVMILTTLALLVFYFKPSFILSMSYIIIVLLTMIRKSKDKSFLRKQ